MARVPTHGSPTHPGSRLLEWSGTARKTGDWLSSTDQPRAAGVGGSGRRGPEVAPWPTSELFAPRVAETGGISD
jgi:hypothetical protein